MLPDQFAALAKGPLLYAQGGNSSPHAAQGKVAVPRRPDLALVGGPIGLTIAALTGLYLLFRYQTNKQKAEFEKLGNAAQDLTNKFIESGENIGSTQNALIAAAKGDVDRRVSELRGRRANITGAISAAGPGP